MSNTDRATGKAKDRNGIVYEDLMNLYTLFVDFFRVKIYDKGKEVIVFMNTQDCILTRRSVRKFTNEPVASETVEQVVSLAAFAPSWKNTQVSRYLAVIDPEDRAQICQYVPDYNARIIGQCPVLLAQSFVKSRSGYERDGSFSTDRGPGWQYYDCGIAAQTLCLAAHDMGLGTVIMGVFDRPALEHFLNIPADQELMALIAMGYPDETPPAPRRKDVQTLLSFKHGQSTI